MGGGAWPFLVRGVICLVNSDNERDLCVISRLADDLYVWSSYTDFWSESEGS